MNAADFSLRQLRAFLSLADLQNFTRAAQASALSQPAFSVLIHRLEQSVGARLFDRNTRSVRLTAEGLLFEPRARQLLRDAQSAVGDLKDHIELRKGRVHLAALPSISAGLLPEVFTQFRQRFAGIELVLSDRLSEACMDLVKGGQADFALVSNNARASDLAELDSRALCAHDYHLVCPSDHPLLSEKRLTLRKIALHPFIQMTRNNSVRQALEAAIHPSMMNTVLEVEHLGTVISMVQGGLGISVVPTFSLQQFQLPGVATRPLALAQLKRQIFVVRHKDRSLSAASQAMLSLIAQKVTHLKV